MVGNPALDRVIPNAVECLREILPLIPPKLRLRVALAVLERRQKALQSETDLSKARVSRYVNGTATPPPAERDTLAAALALPSALLFPTPFHDGRFATGSLHARRAGRKGGGVS